MAKMNFHMHTTGSDGKLTPEETIIRAIELGLKFICLTDHYKNSPNSDPWGENFQSENYLTDILKLKEKYKDKIDISFGTEFNWNSRDASWIKKEIKKRKYDFLIGSVHGIVINKKYYSITATEKTWSELLKNFKTIENVTKEYYKEIRTLAKSGLFDTVGHLDILKIYTDYSFQNKDWYKREVLDTLNVIKKSGMCIEINTSGWKRAKCKEQYPAIWILKEIKKLNIPITIGSDSHYPDEIDLGLEKALEIAKEIGFTHVNIFKNRKRIEMKI
jgi:histidinol-phosphatase (PHP family)